MFLYAVGAIAQVPQERQILVTPHAEHPQIAKDSGLGGPVRVAVTVDQAGNVIAVGEPTGPGNVCPSITRVDVVALREAARAAAVNAKFAPGESPTPSLVFLNFHFPQARSGSNVFTAGVKAQTDGDRQFTAANPLPPDYSGPVYIASNPLPAGGKKTYDGYGDPNRAGTRVVALDSGPRPIASDVPVAGSTRKIPKQISGGVLNGKAVTLPKPPYPPAARAVRASGPVSIQVLIDEDGQIFSASAVSGHPLLWAAARNAACEAVFTPTLLMGNPVKVSGVITYNFVP